DLSKEGFRTLLHKTIIQKVELEAKNEELRRRKQQLEDLRDTYRELYEEAPTGLVSLDDQGVILQVNLSLVRLLGLPRPSILGRPFRDLVLSEDQQLFLAHLRGVFHTRRPQSVELGLRIGSGRKLQCYLESCYHRNCCLTSVHDVTARRNLESSLEQSETQFRLMAEIVPDIIFTTRRNGYCDYTNRRFSEYTGMPVHGALGCGWLQALHPDDFARISSEGLDRLRPIPYEVECRLRTRDGSYRWFLVRGRPVRNEQGAVVKWLGSCTDIHDLKEAQQRVTRLNVELEERVRKRTEELEREREVIQRIMDNIPAMVAFYDETRGFRLVNGEFERRLGWSAGELSEIDAMAAFFPDPEARQAALAHMMEASGRWKDLRVRTKSEEELDTSWANVRLSDGSFIGIGIDISERKMAERIVRESEEKYRLLVQNLPGVVYTGYADWTVDFIDDKIEELTGYGREEFDSRRLRWSDLVVQDDVPSAKQAFRRALETDRGFTREYRIKSRSGDIFWIHDRGKIVCDEEGKVEHVSGVFFDVSDRKQAEAQLLSYQLQLRSLASSLTLTEERERRSLAADLHDSIGQTLTISKLRVDALRKAAEGEPGFEELNEISRLLGEAMDQAQSLIFQLSPPVLYKVGFEAALEYLAEQMQALHWLEVDIVTDAQPIPLQENHSVFLFRAVRELLTNVIKHAQAHTATVRIWEADRHMGVEVEDDGVGFDVDEVERFVCEAGRFGLFSIRERMHHLGGSVKVMSNPGQGTRITLFAPLEAQSEKALEGAR
ncbi:MAG: PAS domain S-box protein, partial [Syntrophobacteria bacterium]